MAAITLPHAESWIVARWAFRRLVESASTRLADWADKRVLEQAVALDGLHFDLLDAAQGRRLALALKSAAGELRSQICVGEQADACDIEFAEALAVLELCLHDVQ